MNYIVLAECSNSKLLAIVTSFNLKLRYLATTKEHKLQHVCEILGAIFLTVNVGALRLSEMRPAPSLYLEINLTENVNISSYCLLPYDCLAKGGLYRLKTRSLHFP